MKVKTHEQLRRAETTLTISQRVAGKESLTEILWLLIDLTVKELGAERGSLFLNDATTGELYSRCTCLLRRTSSRQRYMIC